MAGQEHEINQEMEAIAQQAVLMAREQFEAELDFSGPSLQMVDAILHEFQDDMPSGEELVSDEEEEEIEESLAAISTMMGAYIGEVLRRTVEGRWEAQQQEGELVLMLRAKGHVLSPPLEVFERLTGGSEQSLWERYRGMFPELDRPGPNDGLVRLRSS